MSKESQIENSFIEKLKELKYTYREDIRDRDTLERNFREKFETLNRVRLTDAEFSRLLVDVIHPDVFVSSKRLREINTFMREDGTPLQYTLINIKDWCKNDYEVINQLRINTNNSHHRYDVIILINGIPVVQVELKALEVSPRRAMQQVVDYKNHAGNGYTNTLLCFMQLFIVSNQSNTYYFANNNNKHFSFNAEEQYLPVYQHADESNKKITHLDDFSSVFLSKCELGEMINHYMVLVVSEQKLLIMRPYQIYAVKAIVDCIHERRGNGYIWHTTGSGKTLTSFKTATLLKDNPDIDKCLFVVDRKDLDRQTREEFNKFQEKCVEENTNTEMLVKRMLSDDYADKVIVTTIQKLGIALDPLYKKKYPERLKSLQNKRVVFIFDECHRSQFGDNHKAIREFFPNAQLFGFTGTPIFDKNATYIQVDNGEQASYKITADIFGKELHAYTITHAIEDKNVLRFHIDYFKPKTSSEVKTDGTFKKQAVIDSIVSKHDKATHLRRFNALFATASINDAIEYYQLFKESQALLQEPNEDVKPLNIACVFSPPAESKEIKQMQEDLPQEKADNQLDPEGKKKALEMIIYDYNERYHTNHTIAEFDKYYQDVQQRIKDQKYSNDDYPHKKKIDITIVVDMLLTGFDSKYLNTLYVDKNLKYHGLIQAFSRTNRVVNDTKPYGNILDFRGQEEAVDGAIALFSGEKSDNPRAIWLVETAPQVIAKLEEKVKELDDYMQSQGLECRAADVYNLKGDEARAGFINCFKEVQRCMTQLEQYTDLKEEDKDKIDKLLPQEDLRSFRAAYLATAQELRKQRETSQGDQVSPQVQALDFEFVLFASALIDYDYIMKLIARYTNTGASKQKITRDELIGLVASSSNLINESDDIRKYINSLDVVNGKTEQEIKEGFKAFKEKKYTEELTSIANEHGITAEALREFVEQIMYLMKFDGEKLTDLLAPLDLEWRDRARAELALMKDLIPLLKKQAAGREISGLSAYEN